LCLPRFWSLAMARLFPIALLVASASLLGLTGCAEDELDPDAFYWDVDLLATYSSCHSDDNVVAYSEGFSYGLSFDGSATTLRIDGNTFASGVITGCELEYESGIVGQERPGGFVQWNLLGDAIIRTGGDGCDIPNDDDGNALDWYGTETFAITYSEDPSLEVDCEYEMQVQGVYVEL